MRVFYHIVLVMLSYCLSAQSRFQLTTDQYYYFSGEEVRVSVLSNSAAENSVLTILFDSDKGILGKRHLAPSDGVYALNFLLPEDISGEITLQVFVGHRFIGTHGLQVIDPEDDSAIFFSQEENLPKPINSDQVIIDYEDSKLVTNETSKFQIALNGIANARMNVTITNRLNGSISSFLDVTQQPKPASGIRLSGQLTDTEHRVIANRSFSVTMQSSEEPFDVISDESGNFLLEILSKESFDTTTYIQSPGIRLRGKILGMNQQPIVDHSFIVIIPSTNEFYNVNSNESGVFEVDILSKASRFSCIFLSLDPKVHNKLAVQVENIKSQDLESGLADMKQDAAKRNQENLIINGAFNPLDSARLEVEGPNQDLYDKYFSHNINPNEFQRLSTIEEIFKELVPKVHILRNEIVVYPEGQASRLPQLPLFIINGIPTFDQDFVKGLTPEDIKSIGVISDKKSLRRFFNLGAGGIIVLKLDKDYSSQIEQSTNIIEMEGLAKKAISYAYNGKDVSLESLLYWNPSISLVGAEEFTVSFKNSYESGDYWLLINGVSDSGERFVLSKRLTIGQSISN